MKKLGLLSAVALGLPSLASAFDDSLQTFSVSTPVQGAWVARHGLSSADYQSQFTNIVNGGKTLVSVSGYTVAGVPKFAAIWDSSSPGPWVARHDLTSAQYQQTFNDYTSQGYRLRDVTGYQVGGASRFAAIWVRASGPEWAARHDLLPDEYQNAFNNYTSLGFRPVNIAAYNVGFTQRFAAIWEKSSGPAWAARHGLTSDQYQQFFSTMVAQGYRLVDVSGYMGGDGQSRFACLFEQRAGAAWASHHDMSSADYQNRFNSYTAQGYRLVHVDGYFAGGQERYAAIWSR